MSNPFSSGRRWIALAAAGLTAITPALAPRGSAEATREALPSITEYTAMPLADDGVRRTFAEFSARADVEPAAIRSVAEYEGSRWFLAAAPRDAICLLSLNQGTKTLGCKPGARTDYRGDMWQWIALSDGRQLSAIVVPDGYTELTVTGASDARATRPDGNLAFVASRGDTAVRLSGPDVSPIAVELPNQLARITERAG